MSALLSLAHSFGDGVCSSNGQPAACGLPTVDANSGNLHGALLIVFAIIGAIAVLMIVLSGLRFVLAQGNPQETAKARNTIIYAAIGLVISIAAEAFVAMVLGKL